MPIRRKYGVKQCPLKKRNATKITRYTAYALKAMIKTKGGNVYNKDVRKIHNLRISSDTSVCPEKFVRNANVQIAA